MGLSPLIWGNMTPRGAISDTGAQQPSELPGSVYATVSCVLTDFPLVPTEVKYLLRCLLAVEAFKNKILTEVISPFPPLFLKTDL